MTLRVYDSRRREKVEFTTLEAGKVKMYVCGVTVYDRCHLGHARCYIAFDLVHRWLEHSGYDVHYVQNFTDIDDKIITRAIDTGRDWQEIVATYIEAYYEDMDALNILRADAYPRCTDYVEKMNLITQSLIDKGNAYVADDGVYFHVDSAAEKYGQLTGQNIEAVLGGAGGRVTKTGLTKRDHKDFALWKSAKPGEPTWDSPWGAGRPGWHIECTAMSMDHLGEQFDLHGGGEDLRFPHHEAEIFQGECHSGISPVVTHWLHNGFVNIDGEKMSKSLGNFWTVNEILAKVDPHVLRLALVNAQYRSPIDMNEQLLGDAEKNYQRILSAYRDALKAWGGSALDTLTPLPEGDVDSPNQMLRSLAQMEHYAEGFARAMDDDFNSREAVAKVLVASREIAKLLSGLDAQDSESCGHFATIWLEEFAGQVLGLLPSRETALAESSEDSARAGRIIEITDRVDELLVLREAARAGKDWSTADAIRDELKQMDVVVSDTTEGPVWDLAD
jgi:cysteinyl-tRNA synthetase